MMSNHKQIRLIINADDYGYSPCISMGIREAAKKGVVTATGILANAPHLTEQLQALDAIPELDLGVHLNLSWGKPLTSTLTNKLTAFAGNFPSVHKMNLMLLSGNISLSDVRNEWIAQIEVCQNYRRKLAFLNAHEHIHMLPWLFSLTLELAKTFAIPYIRLSRAEWLSPMPGKALIRNILVQGMYSLNYRKLERPMPIFIGLGQSGKLNFAYIEQLIARLKPGNTYELMCHPGRFDPHEITDDKLTAYHDWEGELQLLLNLELQALLTKHHIFLSHYE